MWCVVELDEEYLRKMEDVLAVYEKPYDAADLVVCLGREAGLSHADVRPPNPPRPASSANGITSNERCGTANVFCAVEPKAGRHFTEPTPNRSAAEFAQIVAHLAVSYPAASKIHVVMDNLNIHCQKSLTDYYGELAGRYFWNRFAVHYTPKHRSASFRASALFRSHLFATGT